MRLDNPSKVAMTDGSFPVKVTAEYTFGQSVQGVALVRFTLWQWYGSSVLYERSVNINSASETFEVDIVDDLKLTEIYYDQNVDIEVEFTETITRKTVRGSSSITIVQYPYTAIFTGDDFFSPNTLYDFKLTLRKFDGTPVRKSWSRFQSLILVR